MIDPTDPLGQTGAPLSPATLQVITQRANRNAPRLFALWECGAEDRKPEEGQVRYWGIQIGDSCALLYPDGLLWGTSGSAEYACHGLAPISEGRLVMVDVGTPMASDHTGSQR